MGEASVSLPQPRTIQVSCPALSRLLPTCSILSTITEPWIRPWLLRQPYNCSMCRGLVALLPRRLRRAGSPPLVKDHSVQPFPLPRPHHSLARRAAQLHHLTLSWAAVQLSPQPKAIHSTCASHPARRQLCSLR